MPPDLTTLIIAMALVTYLPRMLPLVSLSRTRIPPLVLRWLNFVPPAVLAALLIPSIVAPDGVLTQPLHNPYLLASLPAFLAALVGRSMVLTLAVGMAAFVVASHLI